MSTSNMHFSPEWMRPKQQYNSRPQQPPSLPPMNPPSTMSTYSALVSPAPPNQADTHDEFHPFRYSKEDLLKIYKDGGGKADLGLEVERWEGVVREHGSDPIGLREMSEAEKKLFTGPLNSDVRRRQSTDHLLPLSTTSLGSGGSRLNSHATGSPLRERFGTIKRRDSNADFPNSAVLKKQSLSSVQVPVIPPREVGQPSSRTRVAYASGFDGVLNGGDSWVAKRRSSEASQKLGANLGVEGDGDHGDRTEGIKEEIEEENSGSRFVQSSLSEMHDNSPFLSNEVDGSQIDVGSLAGGVGQLSLNTNISNPVDDVQNHSSFGAPPGLVNVEWSYKDPTGTIQGPFSAELMQQWFDGGYFLPDLPVKRTHLDSGWFTPQELRRRCGNDRIFLAPLQPTPPGLPLRTDSPLQYSPLNQIPNEPPPIRSLHPSNLESYINTDSNHSDSPSSSFASGRFGDSSPELNTMGGRVVSGPLIDLSASSRGSGFRTTPDIPASFSGRSIPYSDSPIDGPRSGTYGVYGFSSAFGPSQSQWNVPSNNIGSAYEGVRPSRDGQEPGSQNQDLGINYGSLRSSQDLIVDPLLPTSFNYAVGPNQGTRMLVGDHHHGTLNIATSAGDSLFPHGAQQENVQNQQVSSIESTYAQNSDFTSSQNNGSPQQSSWLTTSEANLQRNVPINDHPTAVVQTLPTLSESSPWEQPTRSLSLIPKDASPWVVATHGPVDKSWGEAIESASMMENIEAESELQPSSADPVPVASADFDVLEPKSETPELSAPAIVAKPQGKSRKQKESKISAPVSQPPQLSQPESVSPHVSPSKPVWQKEDEVKKTISLREIQAAEVEKAEAKKAIEKERERIARVSAAAQDKEPQTFTTSWGLPTSQAGSRGVSLPVKEPVPTSAPQTAAPVWTNVSKIAPAKKTMKEILEEEEKRKKAVPQVIAAATLVASGSRRLHAESSAKPSISASGGAWTTVGPNGKSNPVITAPSSARPVGGTAVATSRTNGPILVRPVSVPVAKPAPPPAQRLEDATPSREFLNWLSESLKGLNHSVSVEEIMHMLLSFPVDADAAIREIISETIYTNSTTMDGRRFADEFVSRRKSDAIASTKNGGASKNPAKPVSIADVVKAAPKTTQAEWGFKVVNKKKKGGRS